MTLLGDEREKWSEELEAEKQKISNYGEKELEGRIQYLGYWKKARGTKDDLKDLNQEAEAEVRRIRSIISGKRSRFIKSLMDYMRKVH